MTSIGSDRQSKQERESDAAFVERMVVYGLTDTPDCRRLVALARRAAAIPDAGAEDVERVAKAMLKSEWSYTTIPAEEGWANFDDRERYLALARAALAVMPQRLERTDMLRAAEIASLLSRADQALAFLWRRMDRTNPEPDDQFIMETATSVRNDIARLLREETPS